MLPRCVAADRLGPAARRPLDDVGGPQRAVRDGLALGVRLHVLARPVRAQRGAHRGEQVAAPPHAGVHRQRHRDVVRADRPGRRVALAGALLALGRHRDRPAGRGDAVVGVRGQGGGVHVDRLRGHEPVVVHQPDAVVVGRTPHPGVRGDRDAELAGHLEGAPLRELRVAGDVEGHLEAEHVVAGEPAVDEVAELLAGRPLRGRLLDVAVGQHEPARDRLERVHRGVGVVDGLQAVRPVDAGGDAGVDGLGRGEEVPGVDVLAGGSACRTRGSTRRSTGSRVQSAPYPRMAVCHMCRWVSIMPGITMPSEASISTVPSGTVEPRPDRGDPVVDGEHIGIREHLLRVVEHQHGAAAQHHRAPRSVVGHAPLPRDRAANVGRLSAQRSNLRLQQLWRAGVRGVNAGHEVAVWRHAAGGIWAGLHRVAGPRARGDHRVHTGPADDVAERGRGTATGLARPTARRILLTLEELGYVRAADVALRADAAGAGARGGVRRLARAVGRRPPAPRAALGADRRVVLDRPARRLGHRVRRPRRGAEDRRPVGADRHPLPGAADLAGQGAARRAHPDEVDAVLAEPSRSGLEPLWQPDRTERDAELREVRARGWALTDQQLALGIRSVAAPIREGRTASSPPSTSTRTPPRRRPTTCSTTICRCCCAPRETSAPTSRGWRPSRRRPEYGMIGRTGHRPQHGHEGQRRVARLSTADPWPGCSSPTSPGSSPVPTRPCCWPTWAPRWSRSRVRRR